LHVKKHKLQIVTVNTIDLGGGAARIAMNLFLDYHSLGHDSWLSVGTRKSNHCRIIEIPNDMNRSSWAEFWIKVAGLLSPWENNIRGVWRLKQFITFFIGQNKRWREKLRGHEDFDFPGSSHLFEQLPIRPDILHFHNLHGNYFDLRLLPWLSQQIPIVLTLHDAWLLSGHCAHSFDCERWKIGCGDCPDLNIYPAISRDATPFNWERKRRIYSQSRLYISTPCRWLMDKVTNSILASSIMEAKVIPNGVDLSVFCPGDKQMIRAKLDIPRETRVLLFAARGIISNKWKDYNMLKTAVSHAANACKERPFLFIALGETGAMEKIGNVMVQFVPYQDDQEVVANYYRAADIYLHATKADTFPNTILEALACGTPVIATAIGGIPEQVKSLGALQGKTVDGVWNDEEATGIIIPKEDIDAMSKAINVLVENDTLRTRLSVNAITDVKKRFDLITQAAAYLDWYNFIIAHYHRMH
jgi:glycosyltransferase involved in cell wall biosynthesis